MNRRALRVPDRPLFGIAQAIFGRLNNYSSKKPPLHVNRIWVFILKFTVLVALLASVTPNLRAQIYFYNKADFPTGNLPQGVVSADFNGDGKPDLAVINSADNTISILMGKADGTFASKVDYATEVSPNSVAVGDFNGDGKLDLAVMNTNCIGFPCGVSTISIFLGNGDGTFQPKIDTAINDVPQSLAVADFNGDGKMDVATVFNRSSLVAIMLGKGDGTFSSPVTYPTGINPDSVITADFNSDWQA